MSLSDFKRLVREQYFMIQLDQRMCLDAIPQLLAVDPDLAADLIDRLHRIVNVVGQTEAGKRLAEIEPLLRLGGEPASARSNGDDPIHLKSCKGIEITSARPQALASSQALGHKH